MVAVAWEHGYDQEGKVVNYPGNWMPQEHLAEQDELVKFDAAPLRAIESGRRCTFFEGKGLVESATYDLKTKKFSPHNLHLSIFKYGDTKLLHR